MRLRSITSRNLLGNILVGGAFIALGLIRLIGLGGYPEAVLPVILLALTITSFGANVSRAREQEDEMSRFHSGRASNRALWTTLIAASCACAIGSFTGVEIELAVVCYFIIGFALSVYGVTFAMLERGAWSC